MNLPGYGLPDTTAVVETIREIRSLPGDDGVEFNLAGIRGSAIRKDAEYDSVRVLIGAALDKA